MIDVKLLHQGSVAALFDAGRAGGFVAGWVADAAVPGPVQALAGGRGGVQLIQPEGQPWVLRHYRRGGLMAKLLADHYVWSGAENTRCFREFRLLVELVGLGLPVSPPVAARYRRRGLGYVADLITVQLAAAQTVAELVAGGRFDACLAAEIGGLIARFHRCGIWHADLNAHNILLSEDRLYLIDFDRGRRRPPDERWRMANLQRLQRSLLKLGADRGQAAPWNTCWHGLLQAYAEGMSS